MSEVIERNGRLLTIEEFEQEIRENVLDEVLDAFRNEWTLDSLASHDSKYEILAIVKRQINQLKGKQE